MGNHRTIASVIFMDLNYPLHYANNLFRIQAIIPPISSELILYLMLYFRHLLLDHWRLIRLLSVSSQYRPFCYQFNLFNQIIHCLTFYPSSAFCLVVFHLFTRAFAESYDLSRFY